MIEGRRFKKALERCPELVANKRTVLGIAQLKLGAVIGRVTPDCGLPIRVATVVAFQGCIWNNLIYAILTAAHVVPVTVASSGRALPSIRVAAKALLDPLSPKVLVLSTGCLAFFQL